MKSIKKFTQVAGVLAVALLLASSSLPSDFNTPAEQAGLSVITIPAGAFIPLDDNYDYHSDGFMLGMSTGSGSFAAEVDVPDNVYIKSIVLYTYDGSASYNICAELIRHEPAQYQETLMTLACTTGSGGYQTVSTWSIGPQFVSAHHAAFIYLTIEDPFDLAFYGVKVKYLEQN